MTDAIEDSYRRQQASEREMGLPSRFTQPGSIDNWRHNRLLDLTTPLVRACPDARWLTVGDGRYGSDAAYLLERGVDVLATSLTDERLRVAHERGLIGEFQPENAEHLSLPDGAVDFVLCKEAYHHFPRPPMALYEMLRVARQAVVLIEPIDNPRVLDGIKLLAKRLLRGDREFQFEPSGNYLYRLNVREVGKLVTAMGGSTIAFRGINDFYHPRFASAEAKGNSLGALVTKFGLAVQDCLSALGLLGYGLGGLVVFRATAAPGCLEALRAAGFRVIELPRNPFVDTA